MALSHKEMTAHIRKCIKRAGIRARVNMQKHARGVKIITVFVTTYNDRFTAEEIKRIAQIARNNNLTGAMGTEIDPKREMQSINKIQWWFEYHLGENENGKQD